MNVLASLDWHGPLGEKASEEDVNLSFVIQRTEILKERSEDLFEDTTFEPYLETAYLRKIGGSEWDSLLDRTEQAEGGWPRDIWVQGVQLPDKDILLMPNEASGTPRLMFFFQSDDQRIVDTISVEIDPVRGWAQGLLLWRRARCAMDDEFNCVSVRCLGQCVRKRRIGGGGPYICCECE